MGAPQQGAGLSIAGAGLQSYGDIVQSRGVATGDTFKAATLENAAQRGRVAAVETGGDYSRKLASDLSNIDAIRAAANTDPRSPTGAAIRDYHESIGLSQKAIAVDQITAQARQEESEAAYLRGAAKTALFAGDLSAGAGLLKAVGQGVTAAGGVSGIAGGVTSGLGSLAALVA
jgi:hypothetical protein